MESKRQLKLYVNEKNKQVWEVLDSLKEKGINPSDYVCNLILEKQEKIQVEVKVSVPIATPIATPKKEKHHILHDLIALAQEYELEGIDGLDISYILPYLFGQGKITTEDLISLIVFSTKLHLTLLNTDDIKRVVEQNYDSFLKSKKDIQNETRLKEFKQMLGTKLMDDVDRAKAEKERMVKEEQERQKRDYETSEEKKRKAEQEEWEKANPGIPYWKKGISEEDIQFINDLQDGKYIQDEEGRYIPSNYREEEEDE